MNPKTPQHHDDVDWSLVWMFLFVAAASIFLISQLA